MILTILWFIYLFGVGYHIYPCYKAITKRVPKSQLNYSALFLSVSIVSFGWPVFLVLSAIRKGRR